MKKVLVALIMLVMILSFHEVRSQNLQEIIGQVADATSKAVYESDYKFDTYIRMEVSDLGDHQITYEAYLTKDGSVYAVLFNEGGDKSVILFDTKNNSVLMLSDAGGEKAGFAMAVNPEALEQLSPDIEESDQTYSDFKTGNTKSILGYTCNEYLIKEGDAEIHVWTSEELAKKVEKEMLDAQQLFGGVFGYTATMNGMVLEYNFAEKSSGEKSTMKVTGIDLNASYTISTGDYQVMSMGY